MGKEETHVDSDGDPSVPKSSFITTSDVLKQLNRQLSDLSTLDGAGSVYQEQKPRFELQKRLPDGSTIPATKDEIAAADFKTKLEQSAKFVSQLESSVDRQYWVEQQRLRGNDVFRQGDYKDAMDIYLTCLVVKENTPDFVRDTFLPVLNNLAQCTLQLGMHTKTILFCEMALEEVSKAKENVAKAENSQEEKKREEEADDYKLFLMQRDLGDSIVLCKILFKLAKALRLTGHYGKARTALDRSLDCLMDEKNDVILSSYAMSGDKKDPKFSLVPYKKAIEKEYRCLDIAEREGKRSFARQKRAMQTVLSSSSPAATSNSSAIQKKGDISGRSLFSDSLYEKSSEPRQYSKLRVRMSENSSSVLEQNDCDSKEMTYSKYYWSVVARVAKGMLLYLAADDDIGDNKVPRYNSEELRTGKKRA